MRTVTLRVGEWVRIGTIRVAVVEILDGVIRWEVLAPDGTEVRAVAEQNGVPSPASC